MKTIITICTAIFFCLFFYTTSYANHLPGSYITVRYSGSNNIYVIKLVYHRECLALPAPTMSTVNYSIIGNPSSTINLPLISSTPVPLISCTPNGFTNCTGGSGMDENIYETSITLLQPGIYRFYNESCCRSNFTVTSNAAPVYVEAILDLQTAPDNSLPDFTTPPEFYFCMNNPSTYYNTATDINGDSIVYSLIPALDNTSGSPTAIIYSTPYSYLNFLASSTPITFSQITGAASFTPNQLISGLMVLKADEYRNGTFIGSIIRETKIQIVNGTVEVNELNNTSINIYPNPATDLLQINSSINIKSWVITDLSGRIIKNENNNTGELLTEINVDEIPEGIYILKLSHEKSTSISRFAKQ